MSPSFRCPPPLQPGDRIAVISPSGALQETERFESGLAVWRDRAYHFEFLGHDQQYGYLAGTDEQRRHALQTAWTSPRYKAIVCSRGGYGSMRLLEQWQWERGSSPKWLMGFSDVTALHWSLYQQQIISLHGPVLTTIAEEPEWSLQRLFHYLEQQQLSPLQGQGWGGGQVTARLLPANLTVATHLLGTPLQPFLEGVILALEDVSEVPYRIDRMLTQWRLSGALQQLAGIAFGRFSNCQAPKDSSSWRVEQVLRDRTQDLNCPIVSNLPFGHSGANAVLPVGEIMTLDGDQGQLTRSEKMTHPPHTPTSD